MFWGGEGRRRGKGGPKAFVFNMYIHVHKVMGCLLLLKGTSGVFTKVQKVTKLWFGHFQELCDNSTYNNTVRVCDSAFESSASNGVSFV